MLGLDRHAAPSLLRYGWSTSVSGSGRRYRHVLVEEGELVVIRFEGGETVIRELEANPFPLVRDRSAANSAAPTP